MSTLPNTEPPEGDSVEHPVLDKAAAIDVDRLARRAEDHSIDRTVANVRPLRPSLEKVEHFRIPD